jgi:hypothetical protein
VNRIAFARGTWPASGSFQAPGRGNRYRGDVHPYGEGFGGREDEGGRDAEEGAASGERDVEDAGPPLHGGGDVAGVSFFFGWRVDG